MNTLLDLLADLIDDAQQALDQDDKPTAQERLGIALSTIGEARAA